MGKQGKWVLEKRGQGGLLLEKKGIGSYMQLSRGVRDQVGSKGLIASGRNWNNHVLKQGEERGLMTFKHTVHKSETKGGGVWRQEGNRSGLNCRERWR